MKLSTKFCKSRAKIEVTLKSWKLLLTQKNDEIIKKDNVLAPKDETIVCLTQQVAEKDLRIDELKKKLRILKKIKFNNNRGLEEKYNRVLQLLEDLKEEAPDSVRSKLDKVLESENQSCSSRTNHH